MAEQKLSLARKSTGRIKYAKCSHIYIYICQRWSIQRHTQHSLRFTVIVLLKLADLSGREIMRPSGHKAVQSLEHQDNNNSVSDKLNIADALMLKTSRKYKKKDDLLYTISTSNTQLEKGPSDDGFQYLVKLMEDKKKQ